MGRRSTRSSCSPTRPPSAASRIASASPSTPPAIAGARASRCGDGPTWPPRTPSLMAMPSRWIQWGRTSAGSCTSISAIAPRSRPTARATSPTATWSSLLSSPIELRPERGCAGPGGAPGAAGRSSRADLRLERPPCARRPHRRLAQRTRHRAASDCGECRRPRQRSRPARARSGRLFARCPVRPDRVRGPEVRLPARGDRADGPWKRDRGLRTIRGVVGRRRPRGIRRGDRPSRRVACHSRRARLAPAPRRRLPGRLEGCAVRGRGGRAGARRRSPRHGAGRSPRGAAISRQPRPTHPPPPQEWTDSERIAPPAGHGGEAPVRVRTALTRTIRARMGTVYAIANQKGGVGKTTTAVNMGACVASDGQQTLVVDLDAQCNATVALGLPKDSTPSSYECLTGEVSVAEAARPAGPDNLWIVPAHVDLAGAAVELPRFPGYETRLRDGLGPVRSRFAYTLLDCPPSLGPVAVNALVAADKVIVPVQAEYLALEGLVQFLDTLKLVRRELNPELEIAGVLITMHDDRTRLSKDVERELREHLPARVFKTVVPRSVRVAEAPSYGIPVSEHDPKSTGSRAYRALADEVLALGVGDGRA